MPSREYRDPSGTVWQVFEVNRLNHRPDTVRPALTSGWLAFLSPNEKRRLPQYPAGWTAMADHELQGLLEAAFVAPTPRYPVPRAGASRAAPIAVAVQSGTTSSGVVEARRPEPPPAPVTGTLGTMGIDGLVRAHARQARQDGVAVIAGMMGVKRALTQAGEDVSLETLRQLRKVFIDEFYFSR